MSFLDKGLYFMGETGYFEELPKDPEEIDYNNYYI